MSVSRKAVRCISSQDRRYLPLVTGVIGIAWPLIANPESSRLRFLFFRTLFGLGWLLLGYVLCSDQDEATGRPGLAPSSQARLRDTI